MARTVRSRQGDTIDAICWRELATTDAVEAVLELPENRGIAALGPVLPTGTLVTLPDPQAVATPSLQYLQLWD